jgi:hypothetical protein
MGIPSAERGLATSDAYRFDYKGRSDPRAVRSRTRRTQIVGVNSETGGKPIDRRALLQEADADAEIL